MVMNGGLVWYDDGTGTGYLGILHYLHLLEDRSRHINTPIQTQTRPS